MSPREYFQACFEFKSPQWRFALCKILLTADELLIGHERRFQCKIRYFLEAKNTKYRKRDIMF